MIKKKKAEEKSSVHYYSLTEHYDYFLGGGSNLESDCGVFYSCISHPFLMIAISGSYFLIFLCWGSDSILDVAQYIENVSAVFSSLVWPRQYLQFLYLCHLFEYMAYLIFNYVFFLILSINLVQSFCLFITKEHK